MQCSLHTAMSLPLCTTPQRCQMHVMLAQVTAYSVITANGQTGTLPTGVNFQIGSGSPGSAPSSSSSVHMPPLKVSERRQLVLPWVHVCAGKHACPRISRQAQVHSLADIAKHACGAVLLTHDLYLQHVIGPTVWDTLDICPSCGVMPQGPSVSAFEGPPQQSSSCVSAFSTDDSGSPPPSGCGGSDGSSSSSSPPPPAPPPPQ